MFEFGADKGIKSSLQAAVGFPTVVRVILPGTLAVSLVLPFRPLRIDIAQASLDSAWPTLLTLVVMILLLGWLVNRLNDPLYELFEGRGYWPRWLHGFWTGRQQRHVAKLLEAETEAREKGDKRLRAEIWVRLRRYPQDEKGKPCASEPTLLGNILAAYEGYPLARYGMDAIFFWPRIWLALDREKKEEIDGKWAVADGLVSMSAICYTAGTLWSLAALVSWITQWAGLGQRAWGDLQVPLGSRLSAMAGCVLIFLSGFLLYRMSIPFHLQNGEIFKSVFDLYRDLIKPMTIVGPDERNKWQAIWSYLQYSEIRCSSCGKFYRTQMEHCPSCACETARNLKALERYGRDSSTDKSQGHDGAEDRPKEAATRKSARPK